MPTPRQQKLIQLLIQNLKVTGKRKTLGEILLDAGYSKEQSENPAKIINSETVQDGLSDFIGSMEDRRKSAISKITDRKLTKASARDNAYVVDVLTKNIQLVQGEPTDITKNTELESLREEIKNLTESVKSNGQ